MLRVLSLCCSAQAKGIHSLSRHRETQMPKVLNVILILIWPVGFVGYLFCKMTLLKGYRKDPAKRGKPSWTTPRWLARFILDKNTDMSAREAFPSKSGRK